MSPAWHVCIDPLFNPNATPPGASPQIFDCGPLVMDFLVQQGLVAIAQPLAT
jgi:hypothetical protein